MDNWSDGDSARVMRVRRYRRLAFARTCVFTALTLATGIWIAQSSGIANGLLATAAAAGLCKVSYLALSIFRPFGRGDGPAGAGRPVRPTSTPPVLIASAARRWPEI